MSHEVGTSASVLYCDEDVTQPVAELPVIPDARPDPRHERWLSRARLLAKWAWPWFLIVIPMAVALAIDLAHRGGRIGNFSPKHLLWYAVSALVAGAFWAVLLHASVTRGRPVRWLSRVLFVFAFTVALGSQTYFFAEYRSYINRDISLFAADFVESVVNQLSVDAAGLVASNLPFFLAATVLVYLAHRGIRPTRFVARHGVWLVPCSLAAACVAPIQSRRFQAATPDMLYLNAVGALLGRTFGILDEPERARPRQRRSKPLPELVARPSRPRNVVLILTESVRSDAICNAYDQRCSKTPFTNALMPHRFPLEQLRSVSSTTATSLAVVTSGLNATADSETMHTWPLLFDYARAAGFDTAYWTSQNLTFGNFALWSGQLGVTSFVSALDLDAEADIDLGVHEGHLADYVATELERLREPFFVTIQLSNTHYPYLVDPEAPQPFQPARLSGGPRHVKELRNHYQNAVHQQDQHVARMLTALRNLPAGERTVVVFTSDHGDAFREHSQVGHTFTVYDEEIHVPGYVDAPDQTLTEQERLALSSRRDAYVFHTDIAPTILDLMGLWESDELAPYRTKLDGQSWLRPSRLREAVPLSNCSAVWSCAFENWGVMRDNVKLLARTPYDRGWRCFDVAEDAKEKTPLHTAACDALKQDALRFFGRLPR